MGDMPGSVRTIDATSQRYESNEEFPPVSKRRSSNLGSQIRLPPSPAESDTAMRGESPGGSPSATIKEEHRITRHIDRGAPGDQAIFSEGKTPERKELAKRKSQYYGDVFAYRESNTSARERVTKESMIVADLRTNVIVHDEYTVITDLSYYLSQRYQRPENSIVVTLAHSLCLLFGGNFDPAYTLTITALPSQLQPVTNKRNAALIATHMQESLQVAPRRGVINFIAIAEENLANDGTTVSGEIEDLEKETLENNASLQRNLSRGAMRSRRRQSMKSLRGLKSSPMPTHNESAPPTPNLNQYDMPPIPAYPAEKSHLDRKAEKVQKMSRRKSFIATIFGKAGKEQ
ncbi:Tautomerase/MIF superfamily [Rhexocercosporidium sp. MPI-PUGE-AT-0058]|nr:Tautomerase/MIF superfamily [Rhexocercosporidium sp. MPI-PUGE-AT-0058]